jgi:predicted permease
MTTFTGDITYALRQFRQAPLFTVTALLTLALGIGGTTAIFSLMHAVMLRSLPVADPARLYRVGEGNNCCVQGGPQDTWGMFSYGLYVRLKEASPEFEEMTAFSSFVRSFSVRRDRVDRAARPLRGEFVSGSYFRVFGIRPFGGRLLEPQDDDVAAPSVAVMSHSAWQAVYGGDPSAVGSTYIVEGHPFTVVGIAPPGFFGETLRANPPDLWLPLQQEAILESSSSLVRSRVSAWLRAIGRLKPGATVDGMSARLTGVLRQWIQYEAGYPAVYMPNIIRDLPKQTITVVPGGGGVAQMRQRYTDSLQLLLGVCVLVLVIACANVANLLLARGMARRHESAVRVALGASARRIVVQAFVESVLLAIGGGIAGLVVAHAAGRLLLALAFQHAEVVPISTAPSIPVLLFAFALSLVTGVVFGTAPAWLAIRVDPIEGLRGARRTMGDRSSLPRTALLVVQAALSVVLVAGATMLARSLNKLEGQDFGYQIPGRVLVSLNRPPASYTQPKLAAMYRDLEQRLNRLPGVQGASLALYNPLTDNWGELILVAGKPAPKMGEEAGSSWDRVSANYMQHLGMTIVRGRGFTAADNETTAPVAIVNEGFVKRFFKSDEDPIGQHFGLDLPENVDTFRIVGIVRDAKFAGFALDKPARPMFFVPLAQNVNYKDELMRRLELGSHFIGGLLLVTNMSPGAVEPVVTRTLSEVDPNLTIVSVRTLQRQVELSFDQERAVATLAGLFGIVALLLAAVGLYGVTAYAVAQRTNEIGIRMALGADRAKVVDLVLRGAFKRVVVGLILGLPLAVGAGRLISAQLYGVSFWDPLALSIAAGSLAVCAFFAAIIPASRAASISPMTALRTE